MSRRNVKNIFKTSAAKVEASTSFSVINEDEEIEDLALQDLILIKDKHKKVLTKSDTNQDTKDKKIAEIQEEELETYIAYLKALNFEIRDHESVFANLKDLAGMFSCYCYDDS